MAIAGACGLVALWSLAGRAALIDDSALIGSEVEPVEAPFAVVQAGPYDLTTTDLAFPAPLQSLSTAVTKGNALVASANAPGLVTFDASPGPYKLLVAGLPSVAGGFGSFSALVVPSGGATAVLDYSNSIQGAPVVTPGESTVQAQFTVSQAGTHRIVVADADFPVPLSQLNVLVTRAGTNYAVLNAAQTQDFDLPAAGTYDLLAYAKAASPGLAGLYTVRITTVATGAVLYDSAQPVGNVTDAGSFDLATTGTYSLAVTDLQFPQPLATVAALVARGADVLAEQGSAGSASFSAQAGPAQLYAVAQPASSSTPGASAVQVRTAAATAYSTLVVASPKLASGAAALFASDVPTAAAGLYRATLADFAFPAPFTTLRLAVVQGGQVIGTLAAAGTVDFSTSSVATEGPVQALTYAQPNPLGGSGLSGLTVVAMPTGGSVLETTQAVGALFQGRTLDVTTSGSYDLTLSDLGFPAPFTELSLAVTRGAQRVGYTYGAGRFTFDATPGRYYINLLAKVNGAVNFGAYGLKVDETSPLPTVTLSASPRSVAAGDQTTLTWTATSATSCTASGAWTGSKATSGTQSVGPVNVESTYALACTGPGGTQSASVTVTIAKSGSGGGGGGALDALLLLGLLAMSVGIGRRPAA